ncbi:MAG TPA: cysteine-rich CWC family protein [Capsulimonadaceae bacterium]|jgi:hypothetical protein
MDQPAPDKKRCPLCGEPNRCAMSNATGDEMCWCFEVPVDIKLIEALPLEVKNVACLCEACLRKMTRCTEA